MRSYLSLVLLVLQLGCAAPSPQPVAIDGARIHFTDSGGSGPVLVFVHGWSCDLGFWNEQIPALSAAARLIAIDLPGHGKSDKPKVDYSMAYWARAVDEVLLALAIDRAFLVGHSNGSAVVRQYYRMFPSKVQGLVVVDGALIAVMEPEMIEGFVETLSADDYLEAATALTQQMTQPGNLTADQKALVMAAMQNTPQHVMIGGLRAAVDRAVWALDPIEVPVLAIHAKQPTWDAAYVEKIKTLAPQLDYHELAGVNHCLMMDVPETFNALLRAFLQVHGKS